MKNKITILFALILFPIMNMAHEPLFGLGPHTMYKYGFALESEFEQFDGAWYNTSELLYGITADWAITLAAAYPLETGTTPTIWALRTKYRFYREDMPGASKQAALHGGIFLSPDGAQNRYDYFLGLSYGYESRRHYFFSGLRYRVNNNIGNIARADIAYGIRPWLLEYLQPDPVFLIELNGRTNFAKAAVAESSTYVLGFSPGLLFSYRNIMFKTGVMIPFLYDGNIKPANELIVGLEYHFPPIY